MHSLEGVTALCHAVLASFLAGSAVVLCACQSDECHRVLASDYDQSCKVDSDCVLVGEVSKCPATACDGCGTQAINKSDQTRYQAAFAQAAATATGECFCPCEGLAVCRAGKCQSGDCAPPPEDTRASCGNAGGRCDYKANTTCDSMNVPDGCAYNDEMCCR
jgi:hypothetical protein